MIFLPHLLFSALLLANPPQESSLETFLPDGAILYLRSETLGQAMKLELSRLRDAGFLGIASGVEDAFYLDQTEANQPRAPKSMLSGFWSGLFLLLAEEPSLAGISDWGRGNRLEGTRQALEGINLVEFAVYPGKKPVQVLHGDVQDWLSVVRQRGPVQQVAKEGKIPIEEIDSGPRKWFVASVAGTVVRTKDLDQMRSLIARAGNTRRKEGLEQSALCKVLSKEQKPETRLSGFVDLPLFWEEPSKPWNPNLLGVLKMFLGDLQGMVFFQDHTDEEDAVRLKLQGEPGSQFFSLFGAAVPGFVRFPQGTLLGVGLHLNLAKVVEFFSTSKTPVGKVDPQKREAYFSAPLSIFDFSRFFLAVDSSNAPAFLVAVRDPDSLRMLIGLAQQALSFAPKMQFRKEDVEDMELYEFQSAEGSALGEKRFYFGVDDGLLFASTSRGLVDSLVKKNRSSKEFLRPEKLLPGASILENDLFLGDLSFLRGLLSGDLSGRAFVAAQNGKQAALLQVQVGLSGQNLKKLVSLWDLLREKKPKFFSLLETELSSILGEMKTREGVSYRINEQRKLGLFVLGERLHVCFSAPFFFELITRSEEEISALPFEPWLISQMKNGEGFKSENGGEDATALGAILDFTPLYEEILRSPSLFEGFLRRAAMVWGWPWFSLEAKQSLSMVLAKDGGLELAWRTNSRAAVQQCLSHFFDLYRPSQAEMQAIEKVMAVEAAERFFSQGKVKDANSNGVGEFASLPELLETLRLAGKGGGLFSPGSFDLAHGEVIEGGYRYRLLLSEEKEKRELRWCLFASPEPCDNEHRLAFYIDERGILFSGLEMTAEQQLEATQKNLQELWSLRFRFKGDRVAQLCKELEPPEHRKVYEIFMPYLTVYGGTLDPSSPARLKKGQN